MLWLAAVVRGEGVPVPAVEFNGSVAERSTSAAREYVAGVRRQLDGELAMHGEQARTSRRYRELARTIAADEIRRVWPHADVEQVLREDDSL